MAKKKQKHKCEGCVWRVYASESKVLCMFSKCVQEEYKGFLQGGRDKANDKKKND